MRQRRRRVRAADGLLRQLLQLCRLRKLLEGLLRWLLDGPWWLLWGLH